MFIPVIKIKKKGKTWSVTIGLAFFFSRFV